MRTRYMVLLLLAENPKTGYEVVKRIKEMLADTGGGASPGTIYPVLRKLEEEKLIESKEEPQGGRKRKVYSITQEGIEYLLKTAIKALEILDLAMELHLSAIQGIREKRRLAPELREQLGEIIRRLEAIRDKTERLVALAKKFLEE